MTQAAQVAQYGSSSVSLGFKNRLMNGSFNIWQRGTTFSVSGANYYWADRWTNASNGYTATRSTDVPTGMAQYSADITTTSTNLGSIVQRIEAANCADLPGQSVTVSFWVKAVSGGGSNGVNVRLDYANTADTFSSTTAILQVQLATTLSSSWTKYSYTFTNLPSGAANGLMLYIFADNTSATQCRYTMIQLEKGSTATSFDYRPYGTELQLCQRYYYRISYQSGYQTALGVSSNWLTTDARAKITTPVTMRTAPTPAASSGANYFRFEIAGSVIYATTLTFTYSQPDGTVAYYTTSGLTAGQSGVLYLYSAGSYVELSAEL